MDNNHCRYCGTELSHRFVDLGLMPLANDYVKKEDEDKGQVFYPLEVKVCEKCLLLQTMEYRRPEEIFSEYKYFSSFSKSWLQHAYHYVEMIIRRLSLNRDSKVFEIACNDGYLLQYFQPHGISVLGIEPAENVALEAQNKGIPCEIKFWDEDAARVITKKHGKADLIIGNNVLAHVPDIGGFVKGVATALKDGGTCTFEFPHVLKLIELKQFDTIYHEHFSYLSLLTVKRIFDDLGLKIYDVETLETHGGSLRIYGTKSGNDIKVCDSVNRIIEKEKKAKLDLVATYEDFGREILNIKIESVKLLGKLKSERKRIVAYGAAAKGNTFLNYTGIGKDIIDFVADASTEKQGLMLPGTLIPIVSPEVIKEAKPDYIIILPWNLYDEVSKELSYTREWGAKFITLIPDVRIN